MSGRAGEDTIDMEERDMGGRGDRSRAGRGGRQEGRKDQILRGPRQPRFSVSGVVAY